MKTRHFMVTSYLVVTAFTLIGIAFFRLLEYYISNERSVCLFGLTPSHACFSILLGGLILAAAFQLKIVVRAFILLICISNLYSLAQIQSSSEQLSFFGASPYQYQTFVMTMAAGLAIYLSSCSVLARRCARTIGVGIILIGSTLLFLEFFPQLLSSASTYVFSTGTTLKLLVLSLGGAPILLSKLHQNQ